MYSGITMDGKHYRVRIRYNTLEQSFDLLEGPNAGVMLSGRDERDLLGTLYSYQLAVEADPAHPEDYDALFWDISAPVDSHMVTLPNLQGTMTFEAKILSGRHQALGPLAGRQRWHGLVINYVPIEPQRVPE